MQIGTQIRAYSLGGLRSGASETTATLSFLPVFQFSWENVGPAQDYYYNIQFIAHGSSDHFS